MTIDGVGAWSAGVGGVYRCFRTKSLTLGSGDLASVVEGLPCITSEQYTNQSELATLPKTSAQASQTFNMTYIHLDKP